MSGTPRYIFFLELWICLYLALQGSRGAVWEVRPRRQALRTLFCLNFERISILFYFFSTIFTYSERFTYVSAFLRARGFTAGTAAPEQLHSLLGPVMENVICSESLSFGVSLRPILQR